MKEDIDSLAFVNREVVDGDVKLFAIPLCRHILAGERRDFGFDCPPV
jgi:hypothetical protein